MGMVEKILKVLFDFDNAEDLDFCASRGSIDHLLKQMIPISETLSQEGHICLKCLKIDFQIVICLI